MIAVREVVFVLLLFGLITSCKEKKDEPVKPALGEDELEMLNGYWELVKVEDTTFSINNVYSEDYGGTPTIVIDVSRGKISGFTGCNSWSTTFSLEGNSLKLNDPLEITQQECPGRWEEQFLQEILGNSSVDFKNGLLILKSRKRTMEFRQVSREGV